MSSSNAAAPANVTTIGYTGMSSPEGIFLSRMFLVGGNLAALAYGCQFIIYLLALRTLLTHHQRSPRAARTASFYSYTLAAFVTALCVLDTIFCVTTIISSELAYVDNPAYPGGLLAYFAVGASDPNNILTLAAYAVSSALADGLFLYRARTIYVAVGGSAAQWWMVIPTLLYLGSVAMSVPFQLASAGTGLYASSTINFGMIYFAMSFALNILLTAMITLRIYTYQRSGRRLMGKDFGRAYGTVNTIFVESAALYAGVSLGIFLTFFYDSPVNQIFLSIGPSTQNIASYLIIYRAAQNRSWETAAGVTDAHSSGNTRLDFASGSDSRAFESTSAQSRSRTLTATDTANRSNMHGHAKGREEMDFKEAEWEAKSMGSTQLRPIAHLAQGDIVDGVMEQEEGAV